MPPGQPRQPGQALPPGPGGQHPSLPPIPGPGAAAWHGSSVADDNALLYRAGTGNGAGYGDGPAAAQLANGFPGGTGYAAPNGNGQDRPGGQAGVLPQGQPAMPGPGSFNGTQNGQYAPWPDANAPGYGIPAPFNGAGLNGVPSYPGMAGYPSPGGPAFTPQAYPNAQQPRPTPQSQVVAQPQGSVQQPPAPTPAPQEQLLQAQAPTAAAPQLAKPAGASAGPVSPAPSQTPAVNSLIESALASQSGSTVRGRRAARKPRLAMSAVFADLVDMADIPRSAYAVDDEVTGSMCLFKAEGGYEVFSCAEDARHEVRFFEDEEAAYFYLFGVLAAEALRNGRLRPAR